MFNNHSSLSLNPQMKDFRNRSTFDKITASVFTLVYIPGIAGYWSKIAFFLPHDTSVVG